MDRRQGKAQTTHIFIANMPKSGSTFLFDVIRKLPGFQRALLIPDGGRREQELDEALLKKVDGISYVAQHHVRHSAWTEELCRAHGLRPVVLVRSLLDVVVSIRDHVRRETCVWPIFFAEPHHAALDDASLERMIVRLALPWYVNFYMGWRQAPDVLMIDYEDLTAEPARVVGDIVRHAGGAVSERVIETTVERVRAMGASRLNVGVSGRGGALRPETINFVLELLSFYPEADGDRYIQAVRSQALGALSGNPAAVKRPASNPAATLPEQASLWKKLTRFRPRRKTWRLIVRRAAPPLLLCLAAAYWIWPPDVIPDSTAYGYVDDALVLMICAYAAGRFSKYK
jgi:uncharacterized membrane protein YkvA (DUF1232 family)